VRPYGRAALLVEPDDAAEVPAVAAAVQTDPAVVEVVPAARTVLVRAEAADLPGLAERLPALVAGATETMPTSPGNEIVLDVRYDGADLAASAAELGLRPDELAGRHADGHYVVAFCGFAPGFAYLTGLDDALRLPRLREPRAAVPAGSVAIADEFTGVYPRSSPGGWRLLGRTDASLWDLRRTPPALLVPGARVRFRAA
jgi:KipI family sensor histidine kinase inhibitor